MVIEKHAKNSHTALAFWWRAQKDISNNPLLFWPLVVSQRIPTWPLLTSTCWSDPLFFWLAVISRWIPAWLLLLRIMSDSLLFLSLDWRSFIGVFQSDCCLSGSHCSVRIIITSLHLSIIYNTIMCWYIKMYISTLCSQVGSVHRENKFMGLLSCYHSTSSVQESCADAFTKVWGLRTGPLLHGLWTHSW